MADMEKFYNDLIIINLYGSEPSEAPSAKTKKRQGTSFVNLLFWIDSNT